VRSKGPRPSDGAPERTGVDVLHFPHQWGFLTDIPSIYQPHDLQHRHLPELFGKEEVAIRDLWYQALCAQAELVAVASTWTRSDLIDQFGLAPGKVQVVPWAPPLDGGAGSDEGKLDDPRLDGLPARFVLYPAQTWPHKNHVSLVRAIGLLAADGLRVPLVLTGRRTADARVIDAAINELGVGGQVTWMGFLEAEALRGVYTKATAVVIPSRFEAASGPLWEAFSAGVPAASSNVTSLPDQAGDAALLFEPERPDEIASAIRRLWNDEGLRENLIDRGRARVAAFTWERTAKTFRAHYRRLGQRELPEEDRYLLSTPPGI
jgi:glycosyltransferase involved in cell wall biosynthesis